MTFNHFAAAKPVEAPKKSKKSDTPRVALEGMALLCDIKATMKNLEAQAAVLESDLKDAMSGHFAKTGAATKVRPENFEGFEGTATGSCQMRLRSSASGFSDDEAATLDEKDIPYDTVVDQPAMYAINPKVLALPGVMDALVKVIGKAKVNGEPLPEDLIIMLPERSKRTATEDSVRALFATGDEKTIRALMPMITTLAIAPKANPNSVAAINAVMKHMNSATDDAQKAA